MTEIEGIPCPVGGQRRDGSECTADCQLCDYYLQGIAKSQSRHLLRILKEPCKKHYEEEFVSHCSDAKERIYPEHKYLCPDCMKEIEKEIEK